MHMHGRGRDTHKNVRFGAEEVARNVPVPILVALPMYTIPVPLIPGHTPHASG